MVHVQAPLHSCGKFTFQNLGVNPKTVKKEVRYLIRIPFKHVLTPSIKYNYDFVLTRLYFSNHKL